MLRTSHILTKSYACVSSHQSRQAKHVHFLASEILELIQRLVDVGEHFWFGRGQIIVELGVKAQRTIVEGLFCHASRSITSSEVSIHAAWELN